MNRLEYFEARCEATLSPMEYAAASDRDPDAFFLVDVRNAPAEKMRVKAAGAHLIPLNTLTERLSEVPKDRTIVLCCWDVWCNMASRAAPSAERIRRQGTDRRHCCMGGPGAPGRESCLMLAMGRG